MNDQYELDNAYSDGFDGAVCGAVNCNPYNRDTGEAGLWEAYEKGYLEGLEEKQWVTSGRLIEHGEMEFIKAVIGYQAGSREGR